MTWFWFKRWLEYKRRKSLRRYKKIQLTSSESLEGWETTTDKTRERLPTVFIKGCGNIPLVLSNAAYVIEKNIRTKGIFQTKGDNSKAVTSLLTASRKSKLKSANVHDVVEAMKNFLISLPEPLLPDYICDALMNASGEDFTSQYVFVLREFRHLSALNFAIVNFVMRLLKKVSENSVHNCMDARKLATILVLDVIKPLTQKDPDDEQCLTESMQRLPFLITVVENLIENVSLFQMVDSLNGVSTFSQEVEHQSPTESCTKCPEINTREPLADFADVTSRNKIALQEIGCCEHCKNIVCIASGNMDTRVNTMPCNRNTVSTVLPSATDNNFKLKDVLAPEMEMPSSIISTDVCAAKSTQRKQKLRATTKKKNASSKNKSVRIDRSKSSPDKKPTKLVRTKNTACTLKKKKQNSRWNTKKSNGDQEDGKYATWSRDADSISGLTQEDIVALSNVSSNTDIMNMATTTAGVPRLLFLEKVVPSKLDILESQESMITQDILENSHVAVRLSTEKHEDRPILNTDISGTATAKNIASPKSMKIMVNAHGETSEMPHISVQYSNHENSPARKSQTSDVTVRSSTGINNSPSLQVSVSHTLQLVSHRNNDTSTLVKLSTSGDFQNGKLPSNVSGLSKNVASISEADTIRSHSYVRNSTQPTVSRCDKDVCQVESVGSVEDFNRASALECNNKIRGSPATNVVSEKAGEYDINTQKVLRIRTNQVTESVSSRSNDQMKTAGDIHHMIVVTLRNEQLRSRLRLRQNQTPRRKKCSLASQQRYDGHVHLGALSQTTLYGHCMVDIFLACTIMLCICLILHNLYYSKLDKELHKQ